MGYDNNDSMVRVDFFKPSGKWYTTVALRWDRYKSKGFEDMEKLELINDTFRRYLTKQFYDLFVRDKLIAICLEPYHEHSCPLMVKYKDH